MRTIIIMWISIIVIVGWDFYYFEPEQNNDLIIKKKLYMLYISFFTKLRLYKFCKKIIIVQFKFGQTIILVNYIGKFNYNVGVPYSFP